MGAREYRLRNRARKKIKNQEYYAENKERMLEYAHEKYINDEEHREWKKYYNRMRMRYLRAEQKKKALEESHKQNESNEPT